MGFQASEFQALLVTQSSSARWHGRLIPAYRIVGMSSTAALFRNLRAIHLYVGVLIAPALIFFAFTGALQTFGLHENSREGSYKAPRWAVVLGQIHKKQTAILPARRPAPGGFPGDVKRAAKNGSGDADRAAQGASGRAPASPPPVPATSLRHPLPLKIFFLLVSLGLTTSTVTGIYMTFLYKRKAGLILGLLLAGIVIPLVLLFV